MAIVLGANQYGKAENRVFRVYRDQPRHEIRDLNVSTSLRGDFSAAHLTGDQADILPTDTQRQTSFAYAKEHPITSIEEWGKILGQHFVDATPKATGAKITIEEYAWDRILVDGVEHDYSFVRRGQETKTTVVTVDGRGPDAPVYAVSGFKDLVVLKTTGSGFKGFLVDKYTILEETEDRIMATSLVARWRYTSWDVDFDATYAAIKSTITSTFASLYSQALQQTLYEAGKAVLEVQPAVAEIKFSAPNKHHFVYPLAAFGLENNNEVFIAADRPYGLIEATVLRDDAPPAGPAWDTVPGFA